MAQPKAGFGRLDVPAWKALVATAAAVIVGLLFIVAGVWKITDPFGAATRMAQALIPAKISLAAAIGFGIVETAGGVFLFVPRFRRWGAWICSALLIAFMIYFAANYTALRGEECSCFPWLKRAVGPEFFIGDALMLAAALLAGWWATPSYGIRNAAIIFCAISVFAGVSYGVMAARQTGAKAPDTITADGKQVSLQTGRFLIYFFDPECSHCDAAARAMAKHNWDGTKVIAVPTRVPQFSREFLTSTGLRAAVSEDYELLKTVFPFVSAPYAVAIEHGRQKASLTRFDEQEPESTLRKLSFIR
jgi:uncharacterized membrane protein YphA (DoxX/SURF4 family)